MARHILKANRSTPRATLYGDLGWVPINTLQNTFRAKYLSRLLNMEPHRWPKLLFNSMLSLNQDKNTTSFKWLNCIQKLMGDLGYHDILENARISMISDTSNLHWAASVKEINCNIFVNNWREDVYSKSSLHDYCTLKDQPGLENYLLDSTNFYGASLKFKLRSNTLPLERRIRKWSPNNNGTCTLCNNGIEDVSHFLFICNKLNTIRINEYKKLENDLAHNNCPDIWELFISGDILMKLHLTLGGTPSTYKDIDDAHKIYCIFDNFCKSYSQRAWKLRSEIKARDIEHHDT